MFVSIISSRDCEDSSDQKVEISYEYLPEKVSFTYDSLPRFTSINNNMNADIGVNFPSRV
jgi:hypothetical protein